MAAPTPPVDYTSRDWASFRQMMLDAIPSRLPEWTSRASGDFGIVLLELFAYPADVLSFYLDRLANEAFLRTAVLRRSVLDHAAALGYEPTGSRAATTTLRFTAAPGAGATANLLSSSQSSFEDSATGWANDANTTFVRTTTQVAHGSWSLQLTADAAGNMRITTPGGQQGIPVTAATTYTATAEVRAKSTARSCQLLIRWYDSAGALLSTTTGTAVPDTTSGWTAIAASAAAPTNAVKAAVVVEVVAAAATEVHYLDKVGVQSGTGTAWVLGGGVTVPKCTRVQTQPTGGGLPVTFQTDTAVVVPPGGTATVTATEGELVEKTDLGMSLAVPGQRFTIPDVPVVDGSLQVFVDEGGGLALWREVDNLLDAGPLDTAYAALEDDQGVVSVEFGDGAAGKIPASNAAVKASYRLGGGARGNVAAYSLVVVVDAVEGITEVTNPTAASGGADRESLTSIRRNAPLALRSAAGAVTVQAHADLALQISGVRYAAARATIGNLLSANVEGLETDASGWVLTTGTSVARTTAQALDGVASLAITASASGAAATTAAFTDVVGGRRYTIEASFRAAATARSCQVHVDWYKADSTPAATAASSGGAVTSATTGWTRSVGTFLAPADAVKAKVRLVVTTTTAAEVHYADRVRLRTGYDGGRCVEVLVAPNGGGAPNADLTTEVTDYLASRVMVDVSTVIGAPTYVGVDIDASVAVLEGYEPERVRLAARAALQSLLAFDRVGFGHRVTLSSVYRTLQNIEGVDYPTVTKLARAGGTGAADIQFDTFEIPQENTITLTATGGTA